MEMFPQNSWKVIDQWLQLFQPLLIWVCLTRTTCRISIFPTGYILPPVGIPFGYLTFQKSIRKNFSTLHGYTCSDTVNTIVIFEIIVVLKTNYLHKQNGFFFKVLRYFQFSVIFCFLKYYHSYMYFNFSAVSNFFPIYADLIRGHTERGCLSLLGRAMK